MFLLIKIVRKSSRLACSASTRSSLLVRRVAYSVSNARVGQITDYDKLTIEIWTNAAVRPDDALAYAAKILKRATYDFR